MSGYLGQVLYGTGDRDYFGRGVAKSHSGDTMLCQRTENASPNFGTGYTRIYRLNEADDEWVQRGRTVYDESGDTAVDELCSHFTYMFMSSTVG
jgi:hypothetical protein